MTEYIVQLRQASGAMRKRVEAEDGEAAMNVANAHYKGTWKAVGFWVYDQHNKEHRKVPELGRNHA